MNPDTSPPNGWLAPESHHHLWNTPQPPPGSPPAGGHGDPQTQWGPPVAEQWHPPHGEWADSHPRSGWKSTVALVVTLAVVAGVIGGIGLAQSDIDEPYDDAPATPGALSSPTVAPGSGRFPLRNPPPPPISLPSSQIGSDTWQLPAWPWDTLPELSEGGGQQWGVLQSPTLALLEPPALTGCEDPATVEDADAYEVAVRNQWSCVHAAWLPILVELGLPTAEPEVLFYSGAAGRSECGRVRAPAFYCPLKGGSAHFGRDDMEVAKYWDLSVNDTVNHEYAHHIQSVVGILDASESIEYTSDIDRRVELQASCWAGAMTYRNEAVVFDQTRWEDWRFSLEDSIPDREHGTLESLRYWSTRGLYADTFGDCNTWSVNAERVS